MNIPLREALSALGGACVVMASVIWAGGLPGWMFLAGSLVALACVLTLLVSLGAGRVARMLLAFEAALAGVQSTIQVTPATPADPVQADVVAALVSLGAKPAKARAAAERTADGPRDLKSWLNRAVRAA